MNHATRLAVVTAAAVLALASPASAEHWTGGRDLPEGRTNAASVTLADGDVLAIGGAVLGDDPGLAKDGRRYDPTTGTWSSVAGMDVARYGPVAAVLADGRVLVAGGYNTGEYLLSAEVYDPSSDVWTPVRNDMSVSRSDNGLENPATRLPSGVILLTGGSAAASTAVDLYDPQTNKFITAKPMKHARALAGQTLLADGRVLVAGGLDGSSALLSGEVYDAARNAWSDVANAMAGGHISPAAATLPDGRAVVASGATVVGGSLAMTAASEIYDPATNRFSSAGAMRQAGHFGGTVATLRDGRVFVAGGSASLSAGASAVKAAETFSAATGTWTAIAPLRIGVSYAAAGVLDDGRLLMAGGAQSVAPVADTQIYTPSTLPSVPRTPSATAGNGTATVSWGVPDHDGDNPIQRYTVTASTGQQVTTPDARTTMDVGSLANGTAVTFTVTATTAFGTGAASAPTAPVTPTGPNPTIVDRTAPTVRISGFPRRLERSKFLRGRRVTLTPNERARLVVTLLGPHNRRLARTTFALSGAVRKRTLKPNRKAVGKAKRFSARLRVVATDAAGNRRTITRTIRVRAGRHRR